MTDSRLDPLKWVRNLAIVFAFLVPALLYRLAAGVVPAPFSQNLITLAVFAFVGLLLLAFCVEVALLQLRRDDHPWS
jgi:hypothetical protein